MKNRIIIMEREFINLSAYFYSIIAFLIAEFVLVVYLIVKFIVLSNNIGEIKRHLIEPKRTYSFRNEFYKYLSSNDLENAKQVLINEIGNSTQFNELIKGGNEMYMKQMKEEIMKVYEKELSLVGLNLNLDVL